MKYLLFFFLLVSAISCHNNTKVQPTNSASETPTLEKATVVSYQNLNVQDFSQAIDQKDEVVILDVRTPEETSSGKIEGAMELNFYDKDFADRLLALDTNKSYYVYCKAGGRSAKTARLMVKNGFSKVFNLEGGYTQWSKEKM